MKNIKTFEMFESDYDNNLTPEQKEKFKQAMDKLGDLLPDLEDAISSIPDDVELDQKTEDDLKNIIDMADDLIKGKKMPSLDDIKKLRDDNEERFKKRFGK